MAHKIAVEDLAICDAPPAFAEKLHVGSPNLGNRARLLSRFDDILDSRWLTNQGPFVQEFEQRLCQLLGVKHCIALCNATIALEITMRALELRDEVIVPSFTFIATAHALQWQGLTPVFCDIDPTTHNLDPRQVERLITPRTSGIVGVHIWGRPCAVEALTEIAATYRLKLLFDAAHALGCAHRGRMLGNFGNAEVFSFHATKFCNAFEGGAVTTNDDALAARIRLMRNFGFAGYDRVVALGTNGKMSEIAAAMGLTSLESLDEFVAVNWRNYELYRAELHGVPGVKVVDYDARAAGNYQYLILEIDEAEATLSRDALLAILWAENVIARRYFYPGCHRLEPYRTTQAGLTLPATERLAARVLLLPTGTAVVPAMIATICQIIRVALANSAVVIQRLGLRRHITVGEYQ